MTGDFPIGCAPLASARPGDSLIQTDPDRPAVAVTSTWRKVTPPSSGWRPVPLTGT